MIQSLKNKIMANWMVETRLYRYILSQGTIKRIRRDELDTTASLHDKSDDNPGGWEIIEVIQPER